MDSFDEGSQRKHSEDPDSKLLVREFSNREISEAIFTFCLLLKMLLRL